ncbi:chemokine (C-C motif) ligand 35, duplicate 1 [Genypterus blacodes]|uniref:chemokine (C-C motif) ligand 35, duplicate 1 n=1 Tax=Genypterus blacodes TaxID=154954 RepID=UPI003F7651EE
MSERTHTLLQTPSNSFTVLHTPRQNTHLRMAAVRLALTVCLLMLAAFTLTEGLRGPGPVKCCYSFNDRKVSKERVVSYVRTSQQCSKPAVRFTTVHGRQLCAKPELSWVKGLVTYLDSKLLPGQGSPV